VLGPAISLYERVLAARGAFTSSRDGAVGDLPVPPAHLRVKISPLQGDLQVFLESGARHADLVRRVLSNVESDPVDAAPLLDFGCGCGRVARHWKDFAVDLHGCDISRELIDWCRQNLPFGRFDVNGLEPPLPYDDDAFGLAYAFSVFTHLPEALQHEWLQEFKRVLRPGGYLIVSTLGEYYAGLDRLTADERQAFREGRLVVLFENHAGENVCSAYHPQAYMEGTFARGFDYLAHEPGDESEPHDIHLLRAT
jgi:SAM-dependent methyltransferase